MNKLLFYCQSSLGIGHTIRSLRIAEGLCRSFEVHFINGGELIEGLEISPEIHCIDLPAIVSDPEFDDVRAADSSLDLESALALRRDIILRTFERVRPEVVFIELYPFGRGRFHGELEPLLLEAKQSGSKVVCGVRDILTKRKDQDAFERKVIKRMNRFFDMLLIHSDPAFQKLDETFSRLSEIDAEICYTGYVVPEVAASPNRKNSTIIASIGGGRFGHELAEAVVRVAHLLADKIPHRIQLFTGPFCPPQVVSRLHRLARGSTNLRIERFAPDLHQRLMTADLSISMGGYNTMMNVVATGVPAMIMGCTVNGGMDQVARVNRLARLGAIEAVESKDLEPRAFADKVLNCLNRTHTPVTLDINGVSATASALERLAEAPAATHDMDRGLRPCVA